MAETSHQISSYSLRCFNPNWAGNHDDRYFRLDKVGQYDLFNIVEGFVHPLQSKYTIVEETKQVFKFSCVTFDQSNRLIYGWMEVGSYGIKSDIIDIESGNVDFKKAQRNAEILKHYFCVFVPKGVNEGICLMHSYGSFGVKTIFHQKLSEHFRGIMNLNLQMNPLAYGAAMVAWHEASAKEVKVTKFSGVSDITDSLTKLGHGEQELIIKAPRKGILGKFRDFFDEKTEQYQLVELLTSVGVQVKTVVEMHGRRRTFLVGKGVSNSVCDIELDDSVKLDGGVPIFDSIHQWCVALLREYAGNLYKGLKVFP